MLSISNLCWNFENEKAFEFLNKNRINLVEMSLTKHFGSWENININATKNLSLHLKQNYNISVCSLQSLFYQKCFNLFEDQEDIIEHFKFILEMCHYLECEYMVFGSPKMRKPKNKTISECDDIFLNIFDKISDFNKNITIGIETNPEIYGCEYMSKYEHCKKILQILSKDNIKFHLDTGCVMLEGSDPIQIYNREKDNLKHIHISTKNLELISKDEKIQKFLQNFKGKKNQTLSIEMLNIDEENLLKCIKFVKKEIYDNEFKRNRKVI